MRLYDEKIIQQRIIGYIIRQERKKYKIKMTDFVEEFGKTRQYYSKIEHGETSISFPTLQSIFKYLGISFEYSYYDEVNDLFDDFMDHLFFSEYESAKKILSKILLNKNWKYSYSYPMIFLAELYQDLIEGKPISPINKSDFQILESFFYEDKYLALFYLGIGYSSFLNTEYNLSIEMLQKALHYSEAPSLQCLSYLWLAIANIKIHQYIYALEYTQKASHIAKQENNPRKDIIVEYLTGEIFSFLLYPKHAIKYFKSCIEISKRLQVTLWYENAYIRLIWNALYNNDYDLVIQYGIDIEKQIHDSNVSFCLSYAYFKSGHQENAYKYFMKIDSKDKLMCLFKELLHSLFNHTMDKQISLFKEIYNYAVKHELYPTIVFACKSLKELALQKKDYKEASRYVEDIINLRKQIGSTQKADKEAIYL